jgi:hypothetical protein
MRITFLALVLVSICESRLLDFNSNIHKKDIQNMTVPSDKNTISIAILGDSITAGH